MRWCTVALFSSTAFVLACGGTSYQGDAAAPGGNASSDGASSDGASSGERASSGMTPGPDGSRTDAGFTDGSLGDSAAGGDSAVVMSDAGDASNGDSGAGACGATASDSGSPFVPQGATGYHDMNFPCFWSTFDTTAVNAAAKGFDGAAFDGRYLYFAPSNNGDFDGVVARYDTSAEFTANSSWSTFDTTSVNANAKGFVGAAFDGHYIYLVPHFAGVVARYDPQSSFTASSSWSTFDITTVNANATGFVGSAMDGHGYLYLVPYSNAAGPDGVVARLDTRASFAATSSWATFDVTSVNTNAKGFQGAFFDGSSLYLVPFENTVVVRYDTTASFTASSSWLPFDLTMLGTNVRGFIGAAFDGRRGYLVPQYNLASHDGVVVQYDTVNNFSSSQSWSTFDTMGIRTGAGGFYGGAFDGRFVYFIPYYNDVNSGFDGVLARYDTYLGNFLSANSWGTFDVTTVHARARGFQGSLFDGRYVYFVPNSTTTGNYGGASGVVARFDAVFPPSVPSHLLADWNGSFL